MTQRSVENKFERTWLAKFAYNLEEIAGRELKEKIMQNSDELTTNGDKIEWTENAMDMLDFYVIDENKKDIMNNCACFYHNPENLEKYKMWYDELKDVEKLHERMRRDFERKITQHLRELNIDEPFIQQVLRENWGVIGRYKKGKITVTKMPANIGKYLAAPTKEGRDYAYCHCPRIRDVFLYDKKNISSTYCYCGGGFYTSLWEEILGKPVNIILKKSLLDGDNTCSFEIIVN